MAKPVTKKEASAPVTLLRRVGPGRFEVVSGVVRGQLEDVRVLESGVSLMVGRLVARAHVGKQYMATLAALSQVGDS